MSNLPSPFSIPEADISWFDGAGKENFEKYVPKDHHPLYALQIGVFQGDATIWLLHNIPDIQLIDVDPWEGEDLIPNPVTPFTIDFAVAEVVYDDRVGKPKNVTKLKMTSDQFFGSHPTIRFNFIYIDGDHHAPQALTDLENAHARLRDGGILAFDDYTNGCYGLEPFEQPYIAFDTFLAKHKDEYEVLVKNGQAWVKKVSHGE